VSGLHPLFFETSPFSGATSEKIELGASNVCAAHHFDFLNPGGAHRESAFDTNAVGGGSSDCEVGVVAAFTNANNRPAEFLDSFPFALFNSDVNVDSIPGSHLGDVWIDWSLDGFYKISHFHSILE
jgi:hypothetical protein